MVGGIQRDDDMVPGEHDLPPPSTNSGVVARTPARQLIRSKLGKNTNTNLSNTPSSAIKPGVTDTSSSSLFGNKNRHQSSSSASSSSSSSSSLNNSPTTTTRTTTSAVTGMISTCTTNAPTNRSSGNNNNTISSSSSCQVRVGVRVRPMTSKEDCVGGKGILNTDEKQNTIELSNRCFTFDHVFDSNMTQNQLYGHVSKPLLTSYLDGFNATIIAYGQTGSGKTFTMGSEAHTELEMSDHTGLIPRFMKDLFQQLEQKKNTNQSNGNMDHNKNGSTGSTNGFHYQLQASFLEVYGEDVHDLLDKSRTSLPLRENESGGIVCTGLTNKSIQSVEQGLQVLHEGTMNRTTAATLMNLTSSRSHAVFTVVLTQHETQPTTTTNHTGSTSNNNNNLKKSTKETSSSAIGGQQVEVTSTSRFTFVDLAGSERMKKTGAEGERAKEGIRINEGLLALGNVINALADDDRIQEGRKIHVPYRQSKLTRLLQDALGGNSQTLFLACVSPSDTNASETLSTLHYANRARNIKNAPTRNVDETALEIQKLQSLNHILQAELIRHKFQLGSGAVDAGTKMDKNGKEHDHYGQCDDKLLNRKDVQEYIEKLHTIAQSRNGSNVFPMTLFTFQQLPIPASGQLLTDSATFLTSPRKHLKVPNSGKPTPSKSKNQEVDLSRSILEDFDPSLLGETNPTEEMAILDQLLEIQNHDQLFSNEKKRDSAKLKEVDGELAEQEVLLLQLRKSLEVYHTMKIKYENLMAELQQLEAEKAQLAQKLQQATADPTSGCSLAIKKEMEKVEQSLVRARNETRKHREMYKKADQEAQKCRTLERKIAELKTSRAGLIKKQQEAATRHRIFTETKTREIIALKRKEQKTEKELSKLQRDVENHRRNLDKRHVYCTKLSDKLKQTESHLMKLLTLRQRELRDRTNQPSRRTRGGRHHRDSTPVDTQPMQTDNMDFFATDSMEVESIKLLLDNVVKEQANHARWSQHYEECYITYSECMRSLLAAVRNLEEVKSRQKMGDSNSNTTLDTNIPELEQSVEELELKVEIAGNELEKTKHHLAVYENQGTSGDDNKDHSTSAVGESIKQVILNKPAPILRRIILESMENLVEAEAHRYQLEKTATRKESVINSLESEIEVLNISIQALRKEISANRQLLDSGLDANYEVARLESQKTTLKQNLDEKELQKFKMENQIQKLQVERNDLKFQLSEALEKNSLFEVATCQARDIQVPEHVLLELQNLWREIGTPPSNDERFQCEIENCLEDTCNRKLEEVKRSKEEMVKTITETQNKIEYMVDCLDHRLEYEMVCQSTEGLSLIQQLNSLESYLIKVQPKFSSAMIRCNTIAEQVAALVKAMGIDQESLCIDLRELVAFHKEKQTTSPYKSNHLSDMFLDRCDAAVKELRVQKSLALTSNSEKIKDASKLVSDMKLSKTEISTVIINGIQNDKGRLPSWWNTEIADKVTSTLLTNKDIVHAEHMFSLHLNEILSALDRSSIVRRKLSDQLRSMIERSQSTLLKAVDGEIDASEAYCSFHDALFRLPPLSKDRIHACISEISMLNEGVDAMTQSEIEALTVVWEALFVSMTERGKFWKEVDTSLAELSTVEKDPFIEMAQLCASDKNEDWLQTAVEDASKSCRLLESRLLKLERTHLEVERLRARQDVKSRIITLDSEICIISATLSEFEEKKCDKQRLTTKKDTSSTLLKEERFRKQMQTKFSSKIIQLNELLRSWQVTEGTMFDTDLLSEEVRALLSTSPRNEFMHLRTVKYKGCEKRTVDGGNGRERAISPPTPLKKGGGVTAKRIAQNLEQRSAKKTRTEMTRNGRTMLQPSPSKSVSENDIPLTRKRKSDEETQIKVSKENKIPYSQQMKTNEQPKLGSRRTNRGTQQPFSPSSSNNNNNNNHLKTIPVLEPLKKSTITTTTTTINKKVMTLDPFGMVLDSSKSPIPYNNNNNKENH